MSIEYSQKMTRLLRLHCKRFSEKDSSSILALSKRLQPDGKCDRLRLSYEEFIQAFSRLSVLYELQQSNESCLILEPKALGRAFDKFFEYAVPRLKESLSQ